MSSMTEAVLNGLRRGAEIAVDPDPSRLRELSRSAAARDYTAEAWQSVGDSLRWAMGQSDPSRSPSQD